MSHIPVYTYCHCAILSSYICKLNYMVNFIILVDNPSYIFCFFFSKSFRTTHRKTLTTENKSFALTTKIKRLVACDYIINDSYLIPLSLPLLQQFKTISIIYCRSLFRSVAGKKYLIAQRVFLFFVCRVIFTSAHTLLLRNRQEKLIETIQAQVIQLVYTSMVFLYSRKVISQYTSLILL